MSSCDDLSSNFFIYLLIYLFTSTFICLLIYLLVYSHVDLFHLSIYLSCGKLDDKCNGQEISESESK